MSYKEFFYNLKTLGYDAYRIKALDFRAFKYAYDALRVLIYGDEELTEDDCELLNRQGRDFVLHNLDLFE